jgi:hypothetical protein
MERLFSWEVTSVAVGLFIAIGLGVLALDDFRLAKLFFLLAAADAIGGIVMWEAKIDFPPWGKILFVFALAGSVGVLAMLSLRYVDKKEVKKSKPEEPAVGPELKVKIASTMLAPAGDGSDLVVFVVGSISNHGAPGAVDDFKMDLAFEDLTVIPGQFPVVPNADSVITFDKKPGKPALALRGSTYWARTARLQPIPNTTPLDGWLMAVFKGVTLKEAVEKKATIVLRGTGTNQKSFSAKWKLGTDHANEKPFTMDEIQKHKSQP